MQMKASAVPPHPVRDLEAKIESQRYEIQSLQRNLQTTQDSLTSWDEVDLKSIQGVRVDESTATSTSSVSRITEPATCHLPQSWWAPRAVSTERAYNAESSIKIGCSSEYASSTHLGNSSGNTHFFYSDDFFASCQYRRRLASTSRMQKLENELQWRSLALFAVFQSRYDKDW